ncbi:hypothetical protein HMPREF1568_3318 [Providencia alcalifaciens PAL-3]|nr:hypothetical protein HMPREF1568_3318 [Providencia alcalifaciens PAL-3]
MLGDRGQRQIFHMSGDNFSLYIEIISQDQKIFSDPAKILAL